MAIDVSCACGAVFRVKDEWAGRKAKCTKCGAVVSIVVAAPAPPPDLTNDDPLGLAGQSAGPPSSGGFSDLFDEDIPIAATASPLSDGAATSGSAAVQLTVQFDVRIPNEQEVDNLIQGNLRHHFAGAKAGTYSQVELEVHVLDWNDHGTKKVVVLSFFGNVNGRRISKNFARENVGMVGAVNMAAKAWDSATNAVRGARLSKQMGEMIESIVDDACVYIDKAAGRRKPSSSKLWEIFDIVKGVLVSAAILITIAFALVKGGTEDLKASLFMALLAGGAVFVVVHTIQIFVMPASFYAQDPRGRRVLSRWKVKSVGPLKVRVGAMVAISVAAFVGFWMLISSSLSARPEQGSPRVPQTASRSRSNSPRAGTQGTNASSGRSSRSAIKNPDDPHFFRQNLDELQSRAPFARKKALERLVNTDTGKLNDPEMHKSIAKAIRAVAFDNSAMPDERKLAIQGLVHWGGKFAGPILVTLLREEPNFVQGEILRQLAIVKEPIAIDLVVDRLMEPGLDSGAAAQCLKAYGPVAEDSVLANMRTDNIRTTELTVQVLAEIGTTKSLPALRSLRNVFFANHIAKDLRQAEQMIEQREKGR